MNKEESLALYAQGREAWNAWANKMIAERDALREAGAWIEGRDESEWNDATRDWHGEARADFAKHRFEGSSDFSGFAFPGDAEFGKATFKGDAGFDQATFKRNASFGNATCEASASFGEATFESFAWFDKATFKGTAEFGEARFETFAGFIEATFKGNAEFGAARFEIFAEFSKATFEDDARFGKATFGAYARLGEARFGNATFKGEARFVEATFEGGAVFGAATFEDNTVFFRATFEGTARFDKATFEGTARFDEATFEGDAWFGLTAFRGYTVFDSAVFESDASFRAIQSKSDFSLTSATFLTVPNFTQAGFAEAPRLDDSRIEPRRSWPSTLAGIKSYFKGDPDLSARWRALKRLAIEGHDHEREQAFFKGELKARRWSKDKPWHAAFLFGLLYQLLSDFGRSLVRPLFWWGLGVFVFAALYVGQHPANTRRTLFGFAWAQERTFALATGDTTPVLACIAGPGDPGVAALGISLRNALLFAAGGLSGKLDEYYACLYGIHSDQAVTPGQLPVRFRPVIPDSVAFLSVAQIVYSAALIFLFLLAVRNHFRIK